MEGGALNARGFFLLAATLAALLIAAGCGSSGGDDEVTVQTGSLSKAEFIEKADSICKAARTEFLAKYTSFIQAHKSEIGQGDKQKEEALFGEVVESVLAPNIEKQIKQISQLGAPESYASEAAVFLNILQDRLDEASANPAGLTATPFPFKKAEDAAKKAGMAVCGESFS
jgi:hypothetical protein